MASGNMNKAGKIAIVLAVTAGVLALSRAIYKYTQHGEVDLGKIALGIGIPILIFVIVKSTSSGK